MIIEKINRIVYVLIKYNKFNKTLNLSEFSLKLLEILKLHYLKRRSNCNMNFVKLTKGFEYCFNGGNINGKNIENKVKKKTKYYE